MKKEKKSFARQAAEGLVLATMGLVGMGGPQMLPANAHEVQVIETSTKKATPTSQQTPQIQKQIKANFNPETARSFKPAKAWKTLSRFKQQKQFKKYSRKK